MEINRLFLIIFYISLTCFYAAGLTNAQGVPNQPSNNLEPEVSSLLPKNLQPRAQYEKSMTAGLELTPLRTEDLYASPYRKGKPRVYRVNDYTEYIYHKPGAFEFLANAPGDLYRLTANAFRPQNLPMLALILSSSAVMVYYDQPILDYTKRFGRNIGLKGSNNQKTYFTIAGQPIQFPHDTDTALYFIGDGFTHISFAVGFLAFGLIKSDNRALQTASQLAEGMVTTAFTSQLLKHITGRESPFVSTRPGGRWVFFPNQIEYHKHVPNFDAYPSGHLATSMMTVTVIAENYPEKKWIRPVGYTLMAILSFEMINNGVHWISDYPLALAIGYELGKIAVDRGRMERRVYPDFSGRKKWQDSVKLYPAFDLQGTVGVGLAYKF